MMLGIRMQRNLEENMRGGRERTTRTLLWHSDPGLGAPRGSHRAVRAVQRLEQTAPNISPVRSEESPLLSSLP